MFKSWLKENENELKEWDTDSALAYVKSIQEHFYGYDIKVIGSVARQGFSLKDLDLLLTPKIKDRKISEYFLNAFCENFTYYYRGFLYEVSLPDGRIVDFFSLDSVF